MWQAIRVGELSDECRFPSGVTGPWDLAPLMRDDSALSIGIVFTSALTLRLGVVCSRLCFCQVTEKRGN